jgi:CBS domain-containing protein
VRAADVMTAAPACCTPETTVKEAARLMAENDCGCLPVINNDRRVVGVVTDRDIACRCVAEGKDADTPVGDVMTPEPQCCRPDDDVNEVAQVMSETQVRRVPVVDDSGCCVGMVAQADVARANEQQAADVVGEVSAASESPSRA